MQNSKKLLRADVKKKLLLLDSARKKQQSLSVFTQLLKTEEYHASKRVSIYLNMQNEIGTSDIIKDMFTKGKQCFVPRYVGTKMDMLEVYSMADIESLPTTKWHIKQPADDDIRPEALATGGLDLIIMPGVAFTREGARLGHGMGYYDTYLHRCKLELGKIPTTIALAFKEQIVESVPVSESDVLVDKVLFEDTDFTS